MIATVAVRALRAADIPTLIGVLGRAYGSEQNFELRLQSYLRMRCVATFVAELDGVAVGMVVGNDYGNVAYISQMAVDPSVQRCGIGKRLMNGLTAWLEERAFAATELDATPAGVPLYERYGFVNTERTDVYGKASVGLPRKVGGAVRLYAPANRAALFAADARAFGADRSEVLALLIDAAPEAVVVAATNSQGLAGYAIAQPRPELLGPIIARDADVAGHLIDAATGLMPRSFRASVSSANLNVANLMAARGFKLMRSLRHMVRGTLPAANRQHLYARINLGQG